MERIVSVPQLSQKSLDFRAGLIRIDDFLWWRLRVHRLVDKKVALWLLHIGRSLRQGLLDGFGGLIPSRVSVTMTSMGALHR